MGTREIPGRTPVGALAHRRAMDLWLIAIGTVGAACCALATGVSVTDRLDRALFLRLNALPDVLYRPAWVVQLLGVLAAPALVAVLALGLRRWRLAAGLLLLIPAKLVVEREVLKQLVHHPRPGAIEPDAILRDVPAAGLAFPSGHAVILFGMVALLSPRLSRGVRTGLIVVAIVAATARVYLGAHTPLDVLGGAAAGLAAGALLDLILNGTLRRPAGRWSLFRKPNSPGQSTDPLATVQVTDETRGDDDRGNIQH